MSQNPQLTLSEAVPMINDWKGGVGLIIEMELAMKGRGLLPWVVTGLKSLFPARLELMAPKRMPLTS